MINYAVGCPHVFDGVNYEKQHYQAQLPNGEIVLCWPNAGYLVSADGSGRSWSAADQITCWKLPEGWHPH